jgi:hypothetical protein
MARYMIGLQGYWNLDGLMRNVKMVSIVDNRQNDDHMAIHPMEKDFSVSVK